MRTAMLQQTGHPVTVEDDETQMRYVLLPLSAGQQAGLIMDSAPPLTAWYCFAKSYHVVTRFQ